MLKESVKEKTAKQKRLKYYEYNPVLVMMQVIFTGSMILLYVYFDETGILGSFFEEFFNVQMTVRIVEGVIVRNPNLQYLMFKAVLIFSIVVLTFAIFFEERIKFIIIGRITDIETITDDIVDISVISVISEKRITYGRDYIGDYHES